MAIPDIIKQAARDLRKNMTPAEKALWEKIRRWSILGKQFQKQKPIFVYEEDSWFPRYIIADFICLEHKIIIEVDGSIHDIPEVLLLDRHKEKLLENRWYRVLRFTNKRILNDTKNVLDEIAASFTYSSSESSPFTKKEKGHQTT